MNGRQTLRGSVAAAIGVIIVADVGAACIKKHFRVVTGQRALRVGAAKLQPYRCTFLFFFTLKVSNIRKPISNGSGTAIEPRHYPHKVARLG